MILKAYKFRIYPTTKQAAKLEQTFGCVRWIWNYALAKKSEAYTKDKTSLSRFTIQKELVNLIKHFAFAGAGCPEEPVEREALVRLVGLTKLSSMKQEACAL